MLGKHESKTNAILWQINQIFGDYHSSCLCTVFTSTNNSLTRRTLATRKYHSMKTNMVDFCFKKKRRKWQTLEKWVAYDRANGLYKSCKHRLDNWNHNLAKSIVSNNDFLSSVKSKPVAAWITFCALFSTRSVTRQLKLYHFYDIYTLHMRVSMRVCVCLRFLLLNTQF